MNRKLFTFGGVGTNAIGELEMFDEETLEFKNLSKYHSKLNQVSFNNTPNISRTNTGL